MAGENTSTSLDPIFKRVWAPQIVNLVSESAKVQRLVKIATDAMVGDMYVQPLDASQEQGDTYGGPTDDVMTLNAPVNAAMASAQVQPYQHVTRAQVGYNALWKAAQAGDKAFERASEHVVKNTLRAARKKAEINLIYGQRPIATVLSLNSQIINIKPASWAPGLWFGSKNMKIDVFQSDGTTSRQAGLVVSAVDMTDDAPTVTVTGTTTGIVVNDQIWLAGTNNGDSTYKSMVGLDRIATNAGVLYNVSAVTYPDVWASPSYAVGGTLGLGKILQASRLGNVRGYEDDYVALIPNRSFEKINADQSTLREYGTDTEEIVNGFSAITFRGGAGKIALVAHPYVKEGEGFLLPLASLKRIATTDITFSSPGLKGGPEQVFFDLPSSTGKELRAYSCQTLFCETPAHLVKMTGITYS